MGAEPTRRLPSGLVTFAFTDVVGSTRAFADHGEAYVTALGPLQDAVARHAAAHGGVVVKTEGDGAFLAFADPDGAVEAMTALQDELESPPAAGLHLRIRCGAHLGEAEPIDDDYLAFAVHVAARISGTAGAGQVIVSQALIDALDAPVGERVGEFELKDIDGAVTLWRLTGDDAGPRATPARRTNVAAPRTTFLGRDDDLRRLAKLTDAPGLVTIVGTGGLGKTRLASEHARRVAGDLTAGAWLVELAVLVDAASLAPTVGAALGMIGSITSDALTEELRRRGDLLVVLDNCEHLVDAVADLVDELVARCPALRVLCTSRESLAVAGEHVVRLAPLEIRPASGPGFHEAVAIPGPAEMLFLSRARDAGAAGDVMSDPAALDDVSALCRLLDGLPLALELAAAQAATQPVRALLDGFALGHVNLRRRGGDARQQSLEEMVRWSLDLLEERQRCALLALAVVPGRFDPQMAIDLLSAVPGADPRAAGALVRQSLLDLDGDLYRMLSTVRHVALRELDADPVLADSARSALFAWARANAVTTVAEVARLSMDQIRASEEAFLWGLPERRDGVGRILLHLATAFLLRSSGSRTRSAAQDIVAEPGDESADGLALAAGAFKLVAGLGDNDLIDTDEMLRLVGVARQAADTEVYVALLSQAANRLDRLARQDEALPMHETAIRLAEQLGDEEGLVGELSNLGVAHHLAGELDLAEGYYRRAASEGGGGVNAMICRVNLGELLIDAGRHGEAAEHLRETVVLARATPVMAGLALALLTEAEIRRGAHDQARVLLRQAERELAYILETDPSISYIEERMRAAATELPDIPDQ